MVFEFFLFERLRTSWPYYASIVNASTHQIRCRFARSSRIVCRNARREANDVSLAMAGKEEESAAPELRL